MVAGRGAPETKADESQPHLLDLEKVTDKETTAGGGDPETKAEEPQAHPLKDHLPNTSYGITGPPLQKVRDKEAVAGGGDPEPKAEESQAHPPKDQLISYDEVEISLPYDSKTMTGFVGLVNNQRGEKAYASALVQMLFHIPCFRKAILEIPETIPIKSLFLSLEELKIDDYSVKMVDRNRVFEEQFGGEEEVPPLIFSKGRNALMLLYALVSYNEEVRLKNEERKEFNTAKRSITIKVINIEEDQHGRNKVLSLTVKTALKFEAFQEAVADYYGVPSHRLRFFTDSDTSPQTLIRAKGILTTVGQAVDGRQNLYLREELKDMEDFC